MPESWVRRFNAATARQRGRSQRSQIGNSCRDPIDRGGCTPSEAREEQAAVTVSGGKTTEEAQGLASEYDAAVRRLNA